MGYLKNE
jgi:long-chain-fatty-acid--CoA ligase ACSBG